MATASISTNTPIITEGGNAFFNVEVTPAISGPFVYYWTVLHTGGTTDQDFSSNGKGEVIVTDGLGSFSIGIINDAIPETEERFRVQLRESSFTGNVIGQSPELTIIGSLSTINIGSAPNDGTGDTIRNAFDIVNRNDQALNARVSALEQRFIVGDIQLGSETIGEYVANLTAGAGITLSNNSGETATPTITVNTASSHFITGAQDAIAAAFNAGTHGGLTISYAPGSYTFDTNDFVIELTGPIIGNALISNLSNTTISTTITDNSVILGQHTTGNYLSEIAVSGLGLSLIGAAGEGLTQTIVSNATENNLPQTIVFRNSGGEFSATTITANVVGNLTGNVQGNVLGIASLNLPLTGGTLTGALFLDADPSFSLQAATKQYVDNYVGNQIAGNSVVTLIGEVIGTGGVNTNITTALSTTGVLAGTYTSVTVDTKGRVTAATNPTTLAGYGITDAVNTFGAQTISGVKTFNEDVFILGNLQVQGNTVEFTANSLIVNDPVMYVGSNNIGDSIDLGFVAHYVDGTPKHTGLVRLNETKEWTFFSNISHSTMDNINPLDPDFLYANVRANSFIGTLTGNADSATILQTTRNIAVFGDITGNVDFNGSSNVTINSTLIDTGVAAGVYGANNKFLQITVDSKGRITSAANLTATTTNITEGTNLYFTVDRVRGNISAGTGINYNSTTGVITNAGVTSFNGNTGDIVFDPGDVSTVLGYTPSKSSSNINSVSSNDTRAVNDEPQTLDAGLYPQIKLNSTDGLNDGGTAHGVLTFRSHGTGSSISDNRVFQIAQTDNSNLWFRSSASTTTWNNWQKIWTDSNDGAGSGLDADLLDGLTTSPANNPNTIINRDASGNFAANVITANSFNGTAVRATNIAGGLAGQIPYQTAPNTTSFSAAGITGQVLTSNGTAAPSWTSQSALSVGSASTAVTAGSATNASNAVNIGIVDDGAAATPQYITWVSSNSGNVPVKVTSTKLTYVPSTGNLSSTLFTGNLVGNADTATRSTNLAGGAAGSIAYQTNTNVTGFTTVGLSTQVLIGGATPSWQSIASLSVGSATNASVASVANTSASTDDTTTNATYYPVFHTSINGNYALRTSSTKYTYNPSTGTLSATVFNGIATQARYADLAEVYEQDAEYSPGTVVVFGGSKEITVTTIEADSAVAGVISTNPAYLMNSESKGLPVALRGRVPCWVIGPVRKGDLLITSNVAGHAKSVGTDRSYGPCIFAKSLVTDLSEEEKLIEVVVI